MGRDVGWMVLTHAVSAAASFLLVAYAVRRLGAADFGAYVVMSSVAALLAIADFSLGTAVVLPATLNEHARTLIVTI